MVQVKNKTYGAKQTTFLYPICFSGQRHVTITNIIQFVGWKILLAVSVQFSSQCPFQTVLQTCDVVTQPVYYLNTVHLGHIIVAMNGMQQKLYFLHPNICYWSFGSFRVNEGLRFPPQLTLQRSTYGNFTTSSIYACGPQNMKRMR